MSDIRVFKTLNGEDIITEVKEIKDTHYIVENPSVLVLQETEQGVRVGLAPFMPYAKGNIALYASAVLAEAQPDDSMKEEYQRVFGKIITQPSSIVLSK